MLRTPSTAATTKKIGPYLVKQKLGEGAFSKVKMAIHEDSGMQVALKIIENGVMNEENLQRETQLTRNLNHPNIAHLYEVIEMPEKKATCLVMEYVEGGDVCDYLVDNGPFPEHKAKALLRQLIDAVHYCHANGVVHRDLKPDNILLDAYGNAKITDFGLCGMLKPGALLESFVGSEPYCSPEILRRQPYAGPEVDVWALGVVLYTLLTASFPWAGKTWPQQMTNAIAGKWTDSTLIPEACKHLLHRMLHPEPSKRATLFEMRLHPWLLVDALSLSSSLTTTLSNEAVLRKVAAMGFDAAEVRKRVLADDVSSPGDVLYNTLAAEAEKSASSRNSSLPSSSPPPPSPRGSRSAGFVHSLLLKLQNRKRKTRSDPDLLVAAAAA